MEWYKILLEAIIFLIISYFIFYKSFLKNLGKKTAELATSKQLTQSVEAVKEKFNKELESFKGEVQKNIAKEIEPLKAALNKENIGFQIYTSEYARLRFQRLDDLYGSLYIFQKFVKENLFEYSNEEDYQDKRKKFFENHEISLDKFNLASLYLDEDAKDSVYALLNECHNAFVAFIQYKNSSPGLLTPVFTGKSLIDLMVERHQNSIERLEHARNKFPEILLKIETEFKRNLTFIA